ncbi:hypothetical protein niasHT_026302 [Heterodera trifolii]|uniref:Uncharacterized protein n=1 Tax=Heterodera trifolii TaxID=157864 RepID=A0ABD2JV62_9BILA
MESSELCVTKIHYTREFMKCPFFALRVLHEDNAYVCQHFIAVIFARACGLLKPERVEKTEVMRAILSVVSKPNEVDPGFKREEEEHINSAKVAV